MELLAPGERTLNNIGSPIETHSPLEQYRVNARRSRNSNASSREQGTTSTIQDQVSFSSEALARAQETAVQDTSPSEGLEVAQLSSEEKQVVDELRRRDAEVRRHEAAHVAAGGAYIKGGPTYQYTRGPDGKQYAISGEVSIDVSKESTPQATLRKASVVRRAALAPANPSGPDRQVAAQASQLETQARQEIAEERRAEANGENDSGNGLNIKIGPSTPTEISLSNDSVAPFTGINIQV